MACKVSMVALQVLIDENLAEKADELGNYLREEIRALKSPFISLVRGKGLLNAIVINHPDPNAAWRYCLELKENGLLAKPTHGNIIRFAPPLVMNEAQLNECVDIIRDTIYKF